MTGYSPIPQHNDPPEWHSPLRLKLEPGPAFAKPVDLPRELQFVAQARENHDLAPLICVFQKHPHIRDAVITALRDEGVRF
jgi:hypothetical protein